MGRNAASFTDKTHSTFIQDFTVQSEYKNVCGSAADLQRAVPILYLVLSLPTPLPLQLRVLAPLRVQSDKRSTTIKSDILKTPIQYERAQLRVHCAMLRKHPPVDPVLSIPSCSCRSMPGR